jgi:hypothetical protein
VVRLDLGGFQPDPSHAAPILDGGELLSAGATDLIILVSVNLLCHSWEELPMPHRFGRMNDTEKAFVADLPGFLKAT